MSQCQCFKADGQQCGRQASTKTGDKQTFCWQHQQCQSLSGNKSQTNRNQRSSRRSSEMASRRASSVKSPQISEKSKKKPISSTTNVLILGLESDITEVDLRSIFDLVGTIEKVNINYDKNGNPKESAIISFSSAKEAKEAVKQYDGAEIDGHKISVMLVSHYI